MILSAVISCNHSGRDGEAKKTVVEKAQSGKDSVYQDTLINSELTNKDSINQLGLRKSKSANAVPVEIDLKNAVNIDVLSMRKDINENIDDADFQGCSSWSLTADEIKTIIRNFESMSSEVQHYAYSYLPCRFTGTIQIDDNKFKYYLNAGSTLTLIHQD